MAGKKSDLGPTGINLTHNVRRLRKDLSYAELSRRLAEIGREIPPLGLRRIESGDRRVDADDLVALAAALDTSPASLLMPAAASRDESVVATASKDQVSAEVLWRWLCAGGPLPSQAVSMMAFGDRAWPAWEHEEYAAAVEGAIRAGARVHGDDK